MPRLIAWIVSSEGLRERRPIEARSLAEARSRLEGAGLFVERVTPAGSWDQLLNRTRITRRHQVHLFQQLEMLLASGVLIPDALKKLKERFPDRRTRRILSDVYDQVIDSRSTLSKALGFYTRSFPPGVVSVIAAGEEAGTAVLAERFGDLAERFAFEDANRRQVAKACAYPAFVVLLASLLYVFLLAAVFPRLTELLNSIGGTLPALTQDVISASFFVRRWWPLLVAAIIGAPFLAWIIRPMPGVGIMIDRAFLGIPLLGSIYRYLTVALICTIYRSLYKASKPAPEIIDACVKLVGNRAFAAGLEQVRAKVTSGGTTLSAAFDQSGLFPPLACVAIELGEQSGRLEEALERVARFYSREAKDAIASLIAVINPMMILLVVGGVGVLLISFFEAVYKVVYVAH